jgi:arylformamidase
MPIYDVTIPISPAMICWPGDPPVIISPEKTVAEHGYNLSRICMGTHTGTHIDAPRHLLDKSTPVDRILLDTLIGRAYVFEVDPQEGLAIQPTDLVALGIPRDATRLLFKTANSDLWGMGPQTFEEHFVHLSKKAAHWLVERQVKLVGIDYLSVDAFAGDGVPAHRELLGAGIVIVEALDLSHVTAGVYQLVVLPLKIVGGDGAPARAVLIRQD